MSNNTPKDQETQALHLAAATKPQAPFSIPSECALNQLLSQYNDDTTASHDFFISPYESGSHGSDDGGGSDSGDGGY